MKEARSHLCSVAVANKRETGWSPNFNENLSLNDIAQRLVAHTEEKMKSDPTYELLTALDSTENSLATLGQDGKDRDRTALKDLKESLAHLMDGLRCPWRMSGVCKNEDPKCLAVLNASDSVKAMNKNRCKSFANWTEQIQSPIFGEGPGNADTRKRILGEMKAELSDGYFGGIKSDIYDIDAGNIDWTSRNSLNGNDFTSLNAAWGFHEEKSVLGLSNNVLETEKVGIGLAKEAASYIPDLSDKKPKDFQAICQNLPCLWGKGKEELYAKDQKPSSKILAIKTSSGYSPFDYQDPAKLTAQGIIPGLQGKGDLGLSKLVNYCKANFPSTGACEVSCGVSFDGAFCEEGTGDCDTRPNTSLPNSRDASGETTVSPAK
jgi:hypothetical protein